jgi:hypothetical protein
MRLSESQPELLCSISKSGCGAAKLKYSQITMWPAYMVRNAAHPGLGPLYLLMCLREASGVRIEP